MFHDLSWYIWCISQLEHCLELWVLTWRCWFQYPTKNKCAYLQYNESGNKVCITFWYFSCVCFDDVSWCEKYVYDLDLLDYMIGTYDFVHILIEEFAVGWEINVGGLLGNIISLQWHCTAICNPICLNSCVEYRPVAFIDWAMLRFGFETLMEVASQTHMGVGLFLGMVILD